MKKNSFRCLTEGTMDFLHFHILFHLYKSPHTPLLKGGGGGIRFYRLYPHLDGTGIKFPISQSRLFQEVLAFLYRIRRTNGFQEPSPRFRMSSEEGLPKKIENPDEYERGLPMEINYNKTPSLLQGSCHFVEEVDRTI